VAADLDLTPRSASPPRSIALRAALVVAAIALLVVTGRLAGGAVAVVVACVFSGAGLTYLSGLRLSIEERLAYGTVIGAVVVSTAGLLLAFAIGLTATTVIASLLFALALSAAGWWRGRLALNAKVGDAVARWARREPWPL